MGPSGSSSADPSAMLSRKEGSVAAGSASGASGEVGAASAGASGATGGLVSSTDLFSAGAGSPGSGRVDWAIIGLVDALVSTARAALGRQHNTAIRHVRTYFNCNTSG